MIDNIPEEDRVLIRALYKDGLTPGEIGRKFECTAQQVRKVVRAAHVSITQQIRTLYNEKGLTRGEIRRVLKCSHTHIQYALGKVAVKGGVIQPGNVFGKLTVIAVSEKPAANRVKQYLCQCSCGETKVARHDCLQTGRTRSCGCIRRNSEYSIYCKSDPSKLKVNIDKLVQVHKLWSKGNVLIKDACSQFGVSSSTYYRRIKEVLAALNNCATP